MGPYTGLCMFSFQFSLKKQIYIIEENMLPFKKGCGVGGSWKRQNGQKIKSMKKRYELMAYWTAEAQHSWHTCPSHTILYSDSNFS
ncbi:uncharacterized protein DS421_1g11600 [Arachis hypogaea]|nr:uncharacterized protein DS421_1g11600 [Arachis hypogaea]